MTTHLQVVHLQGVAELPPATRALYDHLARRMA